MNNSQKAEDLMRAHRMNCAQTVLSVFCEQLGMDRNTALRVASGFGGGMGRGGQTCGAVTGSYMVLGLRQQISMENPRETLEEVYSSVDDFNRRFKEMHGSLICKELLKCDVSTPEGLAKARETNLFTTICPVYVRDAVTIVESLFE